MCVCVCVQFNEENQVYLRGMIVMMGPTLCVCSVSAEDQSRQWCVLRFEYIYMGGSGVPESLDGRSDRLCMSSVSVERTRWTSVDRWCVWILSTTFSGGQYILCSENLLSSIVSYNQKDQNLLFDTFIVYKYYTWQV